MGYSTIVVTNLILFFHILSAFINPGIMSAIEGIKRTGEDKFCEICQISNEEGSEHCEICKICVR